MGSKQRATAIQSARRIALLFAQYQQLVRSAFRSQQRSDLADECTQDVFERLLTTTAEQVRHPRAYLLRVATNVARDHYRRQAARGGANAVALDDLYDSDALSVPSDQEEALLLKQIILSMPELYRSVFLLNRFAGLSYQEIAVRLDISVKTVEWRMSRALQHCAAQLRA